MNKLHRPVLLEEVIEHLRIRPGEKYADLTFGEGGHSEAMIERGAALVAAIDRDTEAIRRYREAGPYRNDARLRIEHGRLSEFARSHGDERFHGILVDLGVSTRQLLEAERGFSFAEAGPLDMRMDPSQAGAKLSDILENMEPEELADALWRNTDLKQSRSLARKIVAAHRAGELTDTAALARLFGGKFGKSHPATVPFLALRMLVNDERSEVEEGLPPLLDLLVPGGRLAVITFHSTEDRVVKHLFQIWAGRCICRERICRCPREEKGTMVTRKPVVSGDAELAANPRARSAKLRVFEKSDFQ